MDCTAQSIGLKIRKTLRYSCLSGVKRILIGSASIPPLPEILESCSLAFSLRDVEDVIAKVQLLLQNEFQRRDYAVRDERHAANFSWTRCAQEAYATIVDWSET